jgi:hypothetical protein
MEKEISEEKINKYISLTTKALETVRKNIFSGKEREAKEIIEMSENYIVDAKHFFKEGNWVNCFGALNYAHGWIDAGVRLEIFDVDDNNLFTIK